MQSDRRGEYLSHEFVNHMKSYGIVSQPTPPYTPQHNRMSERRNQTLLDMVRSMMNLTTLPKSFWGYALESAIRILNMVPTKKVERTPYEIWHGKSPNSLRIISWYKKRVGVMDLSNRGSDEGLELIQEEDTQPSEYTNKEHVGNYRFDETKETSNETKGLKRKARILQKMEDFENSKRSPYSDRRYRK
ncbi:retrotransposon protein, putative, ty1-copia subclass [Tanacetum coccineum]|uniref:Retrotransposon protein, putative, ty1-copia subclass n=1 Tax=Tanacetum coccineum TaxID=301880 RepID=A0ABQ4X682_9ASTR